MLPRLNYQRNCSNKPLSRMEAKALQCLISKTFCWRRHCLSRRCMLGASPWKVFYRTVRILPNSQHVTSPALEERTESHRCPVTRSSMRRSISRTLGNGRDKKYLSCYSAAKLADSTSQRDTNQGMRSHCCYEATQKR